MTTAEKPFRVLCVRADGRESVFQSYTDRTEAERVASALARVGCATRVAGPEELLLERRDGGGEVAA